MKMFLVKKIFLEKYSFYGKIAICIKMLEKFIKFYPNFDARKKNWHRGIYRNNYSSFICNRKKESSPAKMRLAMRRGTLSGMNLILRNSILGRKDRK